MLKKVIKYIDFNGDEAEEAVYFNLTATEALRLDLEFNGLDRFVKQLDAEENPSDIFALLERLLSMAYGEKSQDGRFFVKTEESRALFQQSAAYDALLTSFMQDANKAAEFFAQVVGQNLPASAPKKVENAPE